jgi:glyceraldehyde-3-phosphate dehydrogenase/erythrose-4-phosphate dehydrogenase
MSFDSFHTSGNSPGPRRQPRRIAILGFGTVGFSVTRRLTDNIKVPGIELTSILDLADRSRDRSLPAQEDRSLQEHFKETAGAGLQPGPTFAEAV